MNFEKCDIMPGFRKSGHIYGKYKHRHLVTDTQYNHCHEYKKTKMTVNHLL